MTLWSPITPPPRNDAKPMSPRLARAGDAVAAARGMGLEVDAAPLGRRLAEHQRRAGGRVDLHAVVHLDDFDVVSCRRAPRGGLAHQRRQQVDAEAHIAGAHDRGVTRGGFELCEVVFAEARRADDMDDARLGGERR